MIVIQAFYGFCLLEAYRLLKSGPIFRGTDGYNPPYIFSSFTELSLETLQLIHILGALSITLPILRPMKRIHRIIAALGILISHSFSWSYGIMDSTIVTQVWIAFILIFVSDRKVKRTERHQTILVVWGATGIFLFSYFMAGLWKTIFAGIIQPLNGTHGLYTLDAMARVVSAYLIRVQESTTLGSKVIEMGWISFPLYLCVLAIELASIVVLFRPNLFRIYGIVLVLFHFISAAALKISFVPHVGLILIFLIFSPLGRSALPRDIIRDIPLVARIFSAIISRIDGKERST